LNILSKLGKQGLEWRHEPEAFAGREVCGEASAATAKNTTQPEGARVAPKSAPKRASEAPVDELKEARFGDAVDELEMKVRSLTHMATILSEWAHGQNFYHRDSAEDDDTNRERRRQMDRLMFAIDEIAEKAEDLHDAFQATAFKPSGRATQ
jgi:hypothetical protein